MKIERSLLRMPASRWPPVPVRALLPVRSPLVPVLVPVLALAFALAPAGCDGESAGPAPGEARIEELSPAAGAADAGAAAVITVRFGRDVAYRAGSMPLVLERAGVPVAGQVRQSDARVLEFVPADVLELGASYTVRLSGVRDERGEALPDTVWTFTTAGRPLVSVVGPRMYADAEALAHDSMQGRGSGTPNEARAAQYLQMRLEQAGLEAFAAGDWFQEFTYSTSSSQNVHGVLRGRGALADEWVVIGAHYDHVGVRDGAIHNGADDNASGTAMLLELARLLASHEAEGGFGEQPRRSVLFSGYGAEEVGLIGSNWFCAHPLIPLSSVVGMLNLDMVGRLKHQTITAHGLTSAPEWTALVERYRGSLAVQPGMLIGTDYRCFLQQGRPALALHTGTHPQYHQPSDDAELLDVGGMVQIGNLAAALAANLMLRREPLGH